ncbi:hypothetical protein BFU36_00100 [Sulfolobus sp. A20]|nr:hypothetical protein BFU36_00100 [Sulfolobus sp. A20]TRM90279.1 hypothetical protein DJ526_07530 [Sulfolobus sp. A20-N-G8]
MDYIFKEVYYTKNVKEIKVLTYANTDTSTLEHFMKIIGIKVNKKVIELNADLMLSIIDVIKWIKTNSNGNHYELVLTPEAVELNIILIGAFLLMNREGIAVVYDEKGDRFEIDMSIFKGIDLDDRDLDLLRALVNKPLSSKDIHDLFTSKMNLSKSTAYRVLNKLEKDKYIEKSGDKYTISKKGLIALEALSLNFKHCVEQIS